MEKHTRNAVAVAKKITPVHQYMWWSELSELSECIQVTKWPIDQASECVSPEWCCCWFSCFLWGNRQEEVNSRSNECKWICFFIYKRLLVPLVWAVVWRIKKPKKRKGREASEQVNKWWQEKAATFIHYDCDYGCMPVVFPFSYSWSYSWSYSFLFSILYYSTISQLKWVNINCLEFFPLDPPSPSSAGFTYSSFA